MANEDLQSLLTGSTRPKAKLGTVLFVMVGLVFLSAFFAMLGFGVLFSAGIIATTVSFWEALALVATFGAAYKLIR